MEVGVDILPNFAKDTTDRNRTSPFAFTGNKFEFRSPGSKLSVAGPTTFINTIVADVLDEFADELEGAKELRPAIYKLIKKTIEENGEIIFNGDGYSQGWVEEAKRRGLKNYPTTPDALPHFGDKKNIELFARHNVYSETEIRSRIEILFEEYIKTIKIEARTMLDMANKDIFPAVSECVRDYAKTAKLVSDCGMSAEFEMHMVKKLTELTSKMHKAYEKLEKVTEHLEKHINEGEAIAIYCKDTVIPAMKKLRAPADEIESLVGKKYWPYPTYGELLFYV